MKKRGIQVLDNKDSGDILDLKIVPVRDAYGKIVQGIVIGDTLEQNKAFLLMANKGVLKFNPGVGVGIQELILNNNYLGFRHKIREEFAKDGMKVQTLDLYEGKPFKIESDYE